MKTNLLKSIFISLILVMGVGSVNAETIMRFYCKQAQSWWQADGAAVGAYAWKYSNTSQKNADWPGVRMSKVPGQTDLWYADIDTDQYDRIIFTRVNASGTIADWGAKTGDLTISNTTNQYTISSTSAVWGNPGVKGSWGTYKPTSTVSLTASPASVYVGDAVTLTPSLSSNKDANTYSSTSYSVSPATASVNGNTFTATAAGTYTVTATVTYYAKGCPTLTSTATATASVEVANPPANNHKITYTAEGTGWTYGNSNPNTAEEGAIVKFVVNPTAGYRVSVSSDGPALTGPNANNQYTFTMSTEDVKITVDAKPEQYTITLNDNGGSDGAGTVTATYLAAMPSITAPTRTGYTFNGYFDATSGGTKYYNANGSSAKNWDKTSNTTLYAQWTANQYTITYKDQGGSEFSGTHASAHPTTHTYGTATTLKDATKTGYTFDGWFTKSDCSGTAVTSLGATTYTSDITLYAKWTEIPPTTVYLKPNADWKQANARFAIYCWNNEGNIWYDMTKMDCDGGNYYMVEIPVAYKDFKFVRLNPATTENNWNDGTKWNETGDLKVPTDSKVLFTVTDWENGSWGTYSAPQYAITITNGAGGTVTVKQEANTITSGNKVNLNAVITATLAANDGYSKGTAKIKIGDNAEADLVEGQEYTICGPTTITATWKPDSHKVTFYANGHGTAPDEQSVDHNEKVEEPEAPTADGYDFGGWYTDADCTNAWNFNTDVVTEDMTLYAKWTPTKYTITYNDLYGVTHSNPATYTIESKTITFAAPTSTRTGYTFASWNPTKIEKGSTGNQTVTAQWTINNYNITYTQPTNGSYTIRVGNGAAVTTNTTADYKTTITLANTPATGYHFSSWQITPSVSITNSKTFLMPANHVTIGVTFAANTYKVKFDANGGTGTMSDLPFTYDIAQNLTANVFERTGYNFSGWSTNADGTGTTYADGKSVQNLTAENEGIVTLYAKWTAKTYPVTLDQTEAKVEGTTSVEAIYGAEMPHIETLPTPKDGYAFAGYYDGEQGAGTQYYDAKGASAHVWNKAEDATLYAHFAKAEITQITLDKYTFEPVEAGGTGFVTATPTIEPKPAGSVKVCWRLLYNKGNEIAGHDAIVVDGNIVKFSIAGLAAGTYKIEAVLRAGNDCGSGEVLSTKTINFSIASTYTITVKYTCDGKEIMAASKVPAHVSEETEITALDITGYTFSSWEAGDGVTIKSTNNDKVKITANYDGYLTAKYTARPMVYFKNTLGWKKVYVYTFWDNAYWGDGTGVHPATNKLEQGEMTRIGETDIYYFALTNPDGDYTQNNNANPNYIAFSNVDYRNDNGAFRSGQAIYRGDHKERLKLFVPQKDQTPETHNNTKYYSKGIWMEYNSTESGYQLAGEVPNDDPEHDGWGTRGNKFTAQQPGNYIFTITKHLEANKTYKFKIKNAVWIKDYNNTDNNQWFGYDGTINNSTTNSIHFKSDNDEGKNNGDAQIKTTAAGEYIFTIDLSQGKVLLSVEYPVQVGDYRVIYKDNAIWSQGTAHDANWYHPSRIIKKNKTAEPTKDIISFFISYGQMTTMQFQRVKSITNGKVTWENAGEARIPDNVKAAGVYNFIVTQAANGASISMEDNAEPYTGNYYIRVDALAGKWDNYKTNPENRMTYSAFSESEANSFGEKFSHYATKYCTKGTNIKFTIANDYSPCISDTLKQDVVNPLDNLDSEGTLLNNDIYSANVRFMWNRKTNQISRAYVGPAGDKQSQFLMLRTNVEMQDAAGNDLDPNEGDILDKENDIYAARFTDTQNWIYERTLQVEPGTRVKLYANYPNGYHIYIENKTDWTDVALYAFKGGDQPLGNWPGMRPTRTVEIEGKTYYDFPVNKYVFGSNLIFNNNGNDQQKDNYPIQTVGDYYLTASSSSALSPVKHVATTTEARAQYFRGAYAGGNWEDEHTVEILGGDGDVLQTIRVIYDFKTNRLMRAWVPSGDISGKQAINADLMIIRKHQEDATCITFADNSSELSEVKTVYGTLQFNRWVLNNRNSEKSGIEYCTEKINNQDTYSENVTNTNHPVLPTGDQKSIYERALYFISFPFEVHLSDVFGFGTYGTHWVISTYNGLRRAQRGYFAQDCINEDCTNWDYIWDPADFVLEANKGYLLSLDLDLMRYDNTDFWIHNIDQVELFFPSSATLETIQQTHYTMPALTADYRCTIDLSNNGDPERDRRVKDSYWRCIGVPSFANYDGSLKQDNEQGSDIVWKDNYKWKADESGFPFLYEWNVTDNSLSVQSTNSYTFKSTFAYLVQNSKSIYWSVVNAKPSKIVARQRSAEQEKNYEWKITLSRNDNQEDQTFLRMTDNEEVSEDFDFNQDLAKELNYGRSDIYTLIGYEKAAANSMPFSENTTVVPLGLDIEQAGDYTIAMPEGVESVGVTLLDVETGTRTNFSAGMNYTVALNKGACHNRLYLEISPVQNDAPTDIEYTDQSIREESIRKVLIDGKLYIVCDGVVYDAQGHRL